MTSDTEQQDTGSGAERRIHERLAVDLRARLDADGRDARPARVLDFCVGGLFLMVDGQEDDYLVMAARQIGRGDRLRLTFQTVLPEGTETHVVHVQVARLFMGGMGVAFDPPDPGAIRALQRLAENSQEGGGATVGTLAGHDALAPAAAAAALNEVRDVLEGWVRRAFDETFKSASEALFVEARDAGNNAIQSECMDAMKDVDRVKSGVRDSATGSVMRVFEKLSPGSKSGPTSSMGGADLQEGGLSLVDTASFDDWVTVKNIITRHEPRFRDEAYALARRLSVVSGKGLDEANSPAGVQQFGTSFNEAMQNLGLQRRARKAIYQQFESIVIEGAGELLEKLNELLVARGVLPNVERPKPATPRRVPGQAPRPAPAPQAAPEPDDATLAPPEPLAPDMVPGAPPGASYGPAASYAPAPAAVPPSPQGQGAMHPAPPGVPAGVAGAPGYAEAAPAPDAGFAEQPPTVGHAAAAPGGYVPRYQSPIQPAVSQVGMQRAYQAASSLMGLHRAVTQGTPVASAAVSAALPPGREGGSAGLMGALDQLRDAPEFAAPQPRQPLRLKERLHSALQRDGISLGPGESEAVDVLTTLIEAVLGDPLIQENVKPRIQRLSVPLLKTALSDDAFFAQDAHPARQVVNRLGMLGLPDRLPEGERGDSLQASVDPLLDRVVSTEGARPEAFEEILPELDQLIARQRQRFDQNVSSIVETRERQQEMLAERRQGEPSPPRRVAPELAPWFQRTERLKVGDVVTFKAGTPQADPRTLAWVADDHETFVFTDSEGRQTASVAQQELALEMLRGSAKVLDSPDVPAMDRGVYEMLHQIHRALAEESSRDSVTGLMPLSAFEERVDAAIARSQLRGSKHALLALNLDGFSSINESCGREAGDSLLRKLSRLLERQIGEQGCMTRTHADEFLILLEDHSFQDARRFAERQCRAVNNSRVVFEGEQYPITASIGLVPVTRAGESAGAMIHSARAALAGAKRRGGDQLRVFDPDEDRMPDASDTSADTAPAAESAQDDLGQMLDAGNLVLRRQLLSPLIEESEYKPHYEVLLYMDDKAGSADPVPKEFLLEAERGERMGEVDRWVIHTTLEWMKSHRRDVVKSGGYTINLSGATLADDGFLEYVVSELTESSVPPAKVIFEVTESVAIDRLSSAVDFIRTLRDYGCRFSIDDFGAGHATFSYLKTLPVDFVKIDGMFVRDLAESDNDFAMVKSINEISHLLGKQTIAEYVDSEPALERLKELGVDFAQGDALEAPEPMVEAAAK